MKANDGDDSGAYRFEKEFNYLTGTFTIVQNDSLAFDYQGIAYYDSCFDANVKASLSNLGYTYDNGWQINYCESMVVSDSLLGVKYVAAANKPPLYESTIQQTTWETRKLYRNPYALPLGFSASPQILEDIAPNGNPFQYQNDFFNSLTGKQNNCLITTPVVFKQVSDQEVLWSIEAPRDAIVFGYFERPRTYPEVTLVVNKEKGYPFLTTWSQGMFYIPFDQSLGGRSVTLINNDSDKLGGQVFHAVVVDEAALQDAYSLLSTNSLKIFTMEDGYLAGSYVATEDTVLFTTIPYDRGWSIFVDGRPIEATISQGTFIALQLDPGLHQIEMKYHIPGLTIGLLVSAISLMVFIIATVFLPKKETLTN
jgi:uncharacterized membrane protein YfhO